MYSLRTGHRSLGILGPHFGNQCIRLLLSGMFRNSIMKSKWTLDRELHNVLHIIPKPHLITKHFSLKVMTCSQNCTTPPIPSRLPHLHASLFSLCMYPKGQQQVRTEYMVYFTCAYIYIYSERVRTYVVYTVLVLQ
jgi:hypothetical protein